LSRLSRPDPTTGQVDWLVTNLGAQSDEAAAAWVTGSTKEFEKTSRTLENNLILQLLREGKVGEFLNPSRPIGVEDFGCGNGIKSGLAVADLVNAGYQVTDCTLIDSHPFITNLAERQTRQIIDQKVAVDKSPGAAPVLIHQVVGNFADPNLTLAEAGPKCQRVRLCLGNTVDNFEVDTIYPALARNLDTNDLCVIGLRRRTFTLPEKFNKAKIRNDSKDLAKYPRDFQEVIRERAVFSSQSKLRHFQAEATGIPRNSYDDHCWFDPFQKRWIHSIVLKEIDEQKNPELWKFGFRPGQEMLVEISRVQTTQEQKQDLEKYFQVLATKEDPDSDQTIFILKAHPNPQVN